MLHELFEDYCDKQLLLQQNKEHFLSVSPILLEQNTFLVELLKTLQFSFHKKYLHILHKQMDQFPKPSSCFSCISWKFHRNLDLEELPIPLVRLLKLLSLPL